MLRARLGTRVQSLDVEGRALVLESGERIGFERLILAQGGRPIVPPVFRGRDEPEGVFPVRSLAMARKVRDWLPERPDIVVLGGGLVGSKSSVFLRLAGYNVTLIEKEPHILPTVLSADTARPMQQHLRNMGVDVRVNATVDDFKTNGDGTISEVHVSTGEWITCQTFLIGVGSAPELGFLADTPLVENGELIVDRALRTKASGIFAVGDGVTIYDGRGFGHQPWTWPQAVTQGKLAAANLYRSRPVPLRDVTRVNAQNIAGVPIMILGGPGVGSEVVARPGTSEGIWREFFLEQGRIVGGALVGDISGSGPLHFEMVGEANVRPRSLDLLQARTRAIDTSAWRRLAQDREARFVPAERRKP
jgi:NADPH-dependent 2,4-dienoyl-CoA reductase/sulfur reductase-like enzyme